MVNYQQNTDETTKSNEIFSLNSSSLQSDQFSHHIQNLFVAFWKKNPKQTNLEPKKCSNASGTFEFFRKWQWLQ